MKHYTNNRSFSLVEIIVYMGIVSTVLVSISLIFINVIFSQAKYQAMALTNQNARFILEKIIRTVENADSVNSITEKKIDLNFLDANQNPTIIEITSQNQITIKEGASDTIALNSHWVAVDYATSKFIQINQGAIQAVKIELKVKASQYDTMVSPTRQEFTFEQTYYATAQINKFIQEPATALSLADKTKSLSSQADWEAGDRVNIDTTTSLGDMKMSSGASGIKLDLLAMYNADNNIVTATTDSANRSKTIDGSLTTAWVATADMQTTHTWIIDLGANHIIVYVAINSIISATVGMGNVQISKKSDGDSSYIVICHGSLAQGAWNKTDSSTECNPPGIIHPFDARYLKLSINNGTLGMPVTWTVNEFEIYITGVQTVLSATHTSAIAQIGSAGAVQYKTFNATENEPDNADIRYRFRRTKSSDSWTGSWTDYIDYTGSAIDLTSYSELDISKSDINSGKTFLQVKTQFTRATSAPDPSVSDYTVVYSETQLSPSCSLTYQALDPYDDWKDGAISQTSLTATTGSVVLDKQGSAYYSSGTHTSAQAQLGADNIQRYCCFVPTESKPAGTKISYRFRVSTQNGNHFGDWTEYAEFTGSAIDLSALLTADDISDNRFYIQVDAKLETTDTTNTPELKKYELYYCK